MVRHKDTLSRLMPALLVLALSAMVTAAILLRKAAWHWEQIPLHSFIEGVGGCIALAVAVTLLVIRRINKGFDAYIWLSAGLIGMGILDCFHAVVLPGKEFVWLHSLSNFWGGMFFACVWLPDRISKHPRVNVLPVLSLVSVTLLGFFSLLMPDLLPVMKNQGGFTLVANVLNYAGGGGFLLAALYFMLLRDDSKIEHSPVLLNHCLLFGVSACCSATLRFGMASGGNGIFCGWRLMESFYISFC